MTNKLQILHFPWEIFFWSYDIGCGVKAVFRAGLRRNEPCQRSTLFTVLVLNKPTDLGIVSFAILLINYRNNISNLVVHTLIEDRLCGNDGGYGFRGLDGVLQLEDVPPAFALRGNLLLGGGRGLVLGVPQPRGPPIPLSSTRLSEAEVGCVGLRLLSRKYLIHSKRKVLSWLSSLEPSEPIPALRDFT